MANLYQGRTLHMPTGEIKRLYREAANKAAQVGILADLNLCGKSLISEIVGYEKEPLKKPSWELIKNLPHERMMELYNQGLYDGAIAKGAGTNEYKVRDWRRYHGLAANVTRSHRNFSNFPDKVAKELYDRGFNDTEIALGLNLSKTSVRRWRVENELRARRRGKGKKEGFKECK